MGASPGLYPCQRMWLSRRCPSAAPFHGVRPPSDDAFRTSAKHRGFSVTHTPNARCVPSLLWGSVSQAWSSEHPRHAPGLFRCVQAPARRPKSHGDAVTHLHTPTTLPLLSRTVPRGTFLSHRRPKVPDSPAPGLFRCVSAPAPAPPDTPTLVSWHSARHKKSLIGASPGLYPCQRMWLSRRCPSKAPFMAYGLPQMTLSEPPRSIGDSPSHTRRTQGAYRAFCGEVCRKRGPGAPTARSGLFRCVQASAPAPKEPRRCCDSSAASPNPPLLFRSVPRGTLQSAAKDASVYFDRHG